MFGTTSTAAAGSYGLVSVFKKPDKTSSIVTHSSLSKGIANVSDYNKGTSSSSFLSAIPSTTQELETNKFSKDPIESNSDSQEIQRKVHEKSLSVKSKRSLEISGEESVDNEQWKHYISVGEETEKNSYSMEDEGSEEVPHIAEFIKREKRQSWDSPTCQKLDRKSGNKVNKFCQDLSIWSIWQRKDKEVKDKNLSILLFAEREKITTSLKKFEIFDENLSTSRSTTWNTDSLACFKQYDSAVSNNDGFLIACEFFS
ncbi:hypothetical protein MSU_0137 [Mycoplasma suis str. Illinois]|uniref:Uncharacterized protein n=2 Tax=Mycoplasma suis TaxID=57372 RepID=F0QQB1_MYCSL|nr:hypothetical protein MSU_0137 [Mycoplasma suis str. Illinois]